MDNTLPLPLAHHGAERAVVERITVEEAVAVDEQRIAVELVNTVIRDLFAIGLTLEAALPRVSGAEREQLSVAVDGIDGVIRSIRDVVFGLHAKAPSG